MFFKKKNIFQKKGKGKETLPAQGCNTDDVNSVQNEPIPNDVQSSQVPVTSNVVQRNITAEISIDNSNPVVNNTKQNMRYPDYTSMCNYIIG